MSAAPLLDSSIVTYLRHAGLLREGHFRYRSGRHSAVLLDRDRLLADPAAASRMGYALAKAFFTDKIETVAAPSIWGAGLAQWVGYFLEPRAKVVYSTPKPGGERHIVEDLHDLIDGKRVLLIDNLILSGDTMERFSTDIAGLGGEVLGVGCLWAATGNARSAQPVVGLLNSHFPAYPPGMCPICANGHAEIQTLPY